MMLRRQGGQPLPKPGMALGGGHLARGGPLSELARAPRLATPMRVVCGSF